MVVLVGALRMSTMDEVDGVVPTRGTPTTVQPVIIWIAEAALAEGLPHLACEHAVPNGRSWIAYTFPLSFA